MLEAGDGLKFPVSAVAAVFVYVVQPLVQLNPFLSHTREIYLWMPMNCDKTREYMTPSKMRE